jgi:hypothetical protein
MKKDNEVAYTRVSTLAKGISDSAGLTGWHLKNLALGLAGSESLFAAVKINADDPKALRRTIAEAQESAGSKDAANAGTAVHSLTEFADGGASVDNMPEIYREDVRAYRAEILARNIQIVSVEGFIANDDLQAAGTYDRIVELDGKMYVADIKTGSQAPKYSMETAAQVAIYASGDAYTPAGAGAVLSRDRWGRPLIVPAEADPEGLNRRVNLAGLGVDQDRGLLVHLPLGKSTCELHWLDLNAGYKVALAAQLARNLRKGKYSHVV